MNLKKLLLFEDSKVINTRILYALLLLVILSSVINLSARLYEKIIWEDNPKVFESKGFPLMRSGDPAYFLNIASYLKKKYFNLEISR